MWASTQNLGDDIQTLAAINLLRKFNIVEYDFIDRERLSEYQGPPIKLIMNGWFILDKEQFPPPNNITPIFISFQCNRPKFLKSNFKYFKKHEPIGCRDLSTVNHFKNLGIEAYFTGCLTITFDESLSDRNGVYLVDVNNPNIYIKDVDIDLGEFHGASIIEHNLDFSLKNTNIWFDPQKRMELANSLLDLYRGAELVITSRLHAALPSRAFNTDTIFIHKDYPSEHRFSGMESWLNGMNDNNRNLDLSKKSTNRSVISSARKELSKLFKQLIS